MADAHPALQSRTLVYVVRPQVGDGDAAQMRADGTADQYLGVTSLTEHYGFPKRQTKPLRWIQNGLLGQLILLLDFRSGQTSDEHGDTIPNDLHDFSWR